MGDTIKVVSPPATSQILFWGGVWNHVLGDQKKEGFIENDGKTGVFWARNAAFLSLSFSSVHTVDKEVTDVALHTEIRLGKKREEIKPRKTKITSVVQVKKISGMLYGLIT